MVAFAVGHVVAETDAVTVVLVVDTAVGYVPSYDHPQLETNPCLWPRAVVAAQHGEVMSDPHCNLAAV